MRRWNILESSDARSSAARAVAAGVGALLLITVVGLVTPVPLAIGMVLIVMLTAFAVVSPLGVLLGAIVSLPYFYRPIGVGTLEFAASEFLLLAASAGTVLRCITDLLWKRRASDTIIAFGRQIMRSRLVQMLAILMVAGAFAIIWPFDPSARGASLREFRWSLLEPLVLVSLLIVCARSRVSRALVAASLVAAGVVAATHGLFDIVTGGGVTADNVRRLSGPLPHPNALALFLVRPFVLASALFVLAREWRHVLVAPVAITGIALFGTFSRGAMIAVAVAAAIVAVWVPRRFRVAMGTGAAVAIGMVMIVAGDRMRNLLEGGSVSLRADIWSSSIAMIRDRPVLGYGPDQFLYAYAPRYIHPTAWDERFTSHAHNLIADSWIRLGMVGAAVALFALASVLLRLPGRIRREEDEGAASYAAFVALVALLVHGMIDNAVFGHDLAMSAWLIAWLALSPSNNAIERGIVDE